MKPKKEIRISDYDSSGNLGVTEMFGAIFFMLIGGLTKKYEHYYQIKFQRKNIITGYLLSIIFAFGFIALVFYLSK